MKNFLFIYRADLNALTNRSPEELQASTKKWMDWMGSIAAQDKLTDHGNRLEDSGKVVKSAGVVTDGPYSEIKEAIGGYSMVHVDSYEEAIEFAKGCPIIEDGGNVEVREVKVM
jgi:hypothetical protein